MMIAKPWDLWPVYVIIGIVFIVFSVTSCGTSTDQENGDWHKDQSPFSGKCYEWRDMGSRPVIFNEVPCG